MMPTIMIRQLNTCTPVHDFSFTASYVPTLNACETLCYSTCSVTVTRTGPGGSVSRARLYFVYVYICRCVATARHVCCVAA